MKNLLYPTIITLLSCFFMAPVAYGQLKEVYEKGTIELNNGQKVDGFIKDDELSKIVHKINFKSSLTDKKSVVYDTLQLKSFTLGGNEIFELLHVEVNNMTEEISVFAKLLLRGNASLYKTVYKSDDIYIVQKGNKNYVLQNDKVENGTVSTEVAHYYYKENLSQAINGFSSDKVLLDKVEFAQKDFTDIISAYNTSVGSKNEMMSTAKQPTHFIIGSVGGMYKNSHTREFYVQGTYRTYFPKISQGTSFNIGLVYYSYKYSITTGSVLYPKTKYYTSSLVSLPVSLQQNFLNKGIRPFISVGINGAYYKEKDEKGISQIQKGFQNNFGIGLLFGGGIEADIIKGFTLKGEYRFDIYSHLVLVGIAYNFLGH